MKLKNLKDLPLMKTFNSNMSFGVNPKVLKAEAIKWYKDFHSGHYVRKDGIKCTEDFIKYFFNITSEDLK